MLHVYPGRTVSRQERHPSIITRERDQEASEQPREKKNKDSFVVVPMAREKKSRNSSLINLDNNNSNSNSSNKTQIKCSTRQTPQHSQTRVFPSGGLWQSLLEGHFPQIFSTPVFSLNAAA
jgi:hypothetical protein